MGARLVLVAGLATLTAALLAETGRLTARRRAEGDNRLAIRLFACWWWSAAVTMLLAGAHTALGLAGILDDRVHVALLYATAAPLATGLWGLLYYLLYIYTGSRRVLVPLSVGALAFFAFTLAYFTTLSPWETRVTPWDVRVESQAEAEGPMTLAFGFALSVPVIVSAVLFASLAFRSVERTQRYRVLVVSGAFVLWFGVIVASFLAGWDHAAWWPLAYLLPGLVAAALVICAYRPPAWVQRRFGVEAIDVDSGDGA